jgi:hypothetical protein
MSVVCQARMVRRHVGARCNRAARWIIRAPYSEMLVCGYHRRAWSKDVCRPLVHAQAGER